jgi:hypothetical protein
MPGLLAHQEVDQVGHGSHTLPIRVLGDRSLQVTG